MNYDKIILELMSRVQELEEQMVDVQTTLATYEENEELLESEEESNSAVSMPSRRKIAKLVPVDDGVGSYTRAQARSKAIETIKEKFPDCIVERASRKEGSGIKIIKPGANSTRAIIIKFYHSRTYAHRDIITNENSWHVLNLGEIIGSIYDYVLFSSIGQDGNWNFFLYTPEELGIYREEHRSSDSDFLHLYFFVNGNQASEIREETVDVTDHLNNWDILK